MRELDRLREKLLAELLQQGNYKGDLTPQCLEVIYKLIECVKGIDKINMLADTYEEKYSNNNASYRSYNSYYNGYSRHGRKEKMIEELERMRETAPSDKARDAIETVIAQARLGD